MKIDFATAEAQSRRVLERLTTTPRFRLRLEPQEALNSLAGFFAAEVRSRGRDVEWDAGTCAVLTDVADWLTNTDWHNGLMLAGDVGNGKSTLTYALRRMVTHLDRYEHHFRFMDDPDTGTPCHPEIAVYEARALAAKIKDQGKFDHIKALPWLAIDDLGTEPGEVMDYGSVRTPMVELLEYRYTRGLFTVVSTNLDPTQLQNKYGVRLRDRMREMFHKVNFTQPSYRR